MSRAPGPFRPVGGRDAYCTKAEAYRMALDLIRSGILPIRD